MSANSDRHHDVLVIGSGPGGAALAQRLAATGKRVTVMERGGYLPREQANWDPQAVFGDERYQVDEQWRATDGTAFTPGLHRYVGGNSKVYGAALFRLRERDFEEVAHRAGTSPAWPLPYAAFAPYYDQAEALYQVHGERGEDPTEPPADAPYTRPPVAHATQIDALNERLRAQGLNPFHLPLGILLDEHAGEPTPTSACIKCDKFDGFPCPVNGKADAQVISIDPMLAAHPNARLLTHTTAERIETDGSGRRVAAVVARRNGVEERHTAEIVVVACGALSSALLLLRSASDRHPDGLANRSGLVGRRYMRHEMSVVAALMPQRNTSVFQKTMALSDYYWGDEEWPWPMGLIQLMARTYPAQLKSQGLPGWAQWLPNWPFAEVAEHSLDFWLQAEDLPIAENRVHYVGDQVRLDLKPTSTAALSQLEERLRRALDRAGLAAKFVHRGVYLSHDIPESGTSHQAGTAVFGTDPATSVLDLDCRAHELDNLYLADASFFPSIGAVNPTLTIIANALRVADRIAERL